MKTSDRYILTVYNGGKSEEVVSGKYLDIVADAAISRLMTLPSPILVRMNMALEQRGHPSYVFSQAIQFELAVRRLGIDGLSGVSRGYRVIAEGDEMTGLGFYANVSHAGRIHQYITFADYGEAGASDLYDGLWLWEKDILSGAWFSDNPNAGHWSD